MAGRAGRVTAAQVADAAGVSQSTVSFVLNDTPGQTISGAVRERVRSAAERPGYAPDGYARALAKRLRARLPSLKIIAVAWEQEKGLRRARERLLSTVDGMASSGVGALQELERLGFHAPSSEGLAEVGRAAP